MIKNTIYFNVMYEDNKNDVDIISVPSHIATNIKFLSQVFLDWLPSATDDIYWRIIDGSKCSICETNGFVKWLNDNYSQSGQIVTIVKNNVHFVKEYDTIEF